MSGKYEKYILTDLVVPDEDDARVPARQLRALLPQPRHAVGG